MCYTGIPDPKCTYPSEAELAMWIERREAAQMAEALKKAVPDKKEHPIQIRIITLVLAYSTFFYGLWYGINRNMGYEVRYRFAEISIAVITISLTILLIWGVVRLYHTIRQKQSGIDTCLWSCCDICAFDHWNEQSECSVRNGWNRNGDWL